MTSPGIGPLAVVVGKRLTMATTPSPSAIRTRVPKNSASICPKRDGLLFINVRSMENRIAVDSENGFGVQLVPPELAAHEKKGPGPLQEHYLSLIRGSKRGTLPWLARVGLRGLS